MGQKSVFFVVFDKKYGLKSVFLGTF